MVRKGQRYPTATRQETGDLHHRKASADIVVSIAHSHDEWSIAIALSQQTRPIRVMENMGLGMYGRQGVPTRVREVQEKCFKFTSPQGSSFQRFRRRSISLEATDSPPIFGEAFW